MNHSFAILCGLVLSACSLIAPEADPLPHTITLDRLTVEPTGDCEFMSITLSDAGFTVSEDGRILEDQKYSSFWTEPLPDIDGQIGFGLFKHSEPQNALTVISTINERNEAWPDEANPIQEIFFYPTEKSNLTSREAWEVFRFGRLTYSALLYECRD